MDRFIRSTTHSVVISNISGSFILVGMFVTWSCFLYDVDLGVFALSFLFFRLVLGETTAKSLFTIRGMKVISFGFYGSRRRPLLPEYGVHHPLY